MFYWHELSGLALTAVCLLAAVRDVKTRRIPTALCAGGVLVGLALRGLAGWPALLDSLLGLGLGFGVGFLLFVLGILGGGDGKLLAAVGAFFGAGRLPGALLAIAVAGGIVALASAAGTGRLGPVLLATGRRIRTLVWFGRAGLRVGAEEEARVPYGVAIALGAIVWWYWGVPLT